METRTYADRREYLINAVTLKRRRLKMMAIECLGGKCVICGYNKFRGALEMHHVWGEKKFTIGNIGYSRSWKTVMEEVEKCILLCSNCHREVEAGISLVPKSKLKVRKFRRVTVK